MKTHTIGKAFLASLAGLSVILASPSARAQPNAEAAGPPAPRTGADVPAAPPGPRSGDASSVPEAPGTGNPSNVVEPPAAPSGSKFEFYGALLPFVDHVSTSGATPVGFTGGASQVLDSLYTGIDAPARVRMTSGTSGIGFRGTLDVFAQLKVTWQVEAAVPIDGNGPRDYYTLASRNSHIGFTGGWGTLIWGIWDTPWKWATLVTINPIKGSFAGDYTAILSTPGFGVSAVNAISILQGDVSNAAFYRREANSIQYWSPTVAGFSLRLNGTINEDRPSPTDKLIRSNPYLLSGYLGFDGGGLRVRYAYELHHDYFGMYNLGALPSDEATSSNDQGHQLTVQYALTLKPQLRTRLVATGELLSYRSKDNVPDAFDAYSRPAYYALLEQTVFGHRVWAAYGQAFAGQCHRVGGAACSTTGLGARMASAGYLYAFNDNVNLYLAGYRVTNNVSAMHSAAPPLNFQTPGSDITGVGMGLFYSFGVGLGR